MSADSVGSSARSGGAGVVELGPTAASVRAADALPIPQFSGDDLETALAVLSMQARHDERVASDEQQRVASQAQEEAQARKIAKMRELADDELTQGLVEGILGGAAALASATGAVCELKEAITAVGAYKAGFKLQVGMYRAGSQALSAGQTMGGLFAKGAQDRDREDVAQAEADVERSKASAETAATVGKRAEDDVRETISAIRQYLAAKAQIGQSEIIRG